MTYTRANLKDQVFDTTSQANIGSAITIQDLLNRVVRRVYGEVDLRTAKRKTQISPGLFKDVFTYPWPTDAKGLGLIDVDPQVNRSSDFELYLTTPEEFQRRKSLEYNLAAIRESDFVKKLLLNVNVDDDSLSVSTLDSLTSGGGTWQAFGDAENVTADADDFVMGTGSIKFGINAAGGTTAGIYNDDLDEFDFSDYVDNNRSIFYFTLDDVAQLDFKPPEVAGGIYTNLIGRSLEAADQFFRSVAASAELHAQAYTTATNKGLKGKAFQEVYEEFVTNPPVEAMKSISRQGARAVFRQPGGKIISALTSLKNDFDLKLPSGKTVKVFNPLKFVTPFVSTPANIIKSSLEVTPIGFFTGFFRETAREQSLALGKAAFGTVALLPLALMAAEGRISGSGPKDKELRDLLYSTGWQPNSIRIGDKWYSYSNFQPLALPLSVMANAFELHHYEGGDVDPTAVIAKTANSLFQQSYLSGLAALQDALENPESFGKSFANKFLTSVVPLSGFRGQLTRAEDEVVRSPSTLSESVKSTIPGLSDEVRPRLNAFGEESTRDTGLPQPLEFLANFLSPVDVRQVKDTPLSQELFRLRDDIQIGLPSKSFTINNAKIELTPDEQNELIKVSGQRIKERLEKAMESESWATRSDEAKAKFIKKLIEDSREQAKKALIHQSDRIKDQIKQSRQKAQ